MIDQSIRAAIEYFERLSAETKRKVKDAVNKELLDIQAALMTASPVDTGIFRSSWSIDPASITGNKIQGSVYNPMVYAEVLEYGSKKGERPWKSAGLRTVESNGRIWSSQAKDGVISQTIDQSEIDQITEKIADSVIGE